MKRSDAALTLILAFAENNRNNPPGGHLWSSQPIRYIAPCHTLVEDKQSFDALVIKSSILTPPSLRVDEFPSLAPYILTLFTELRASSISLISKSVTAQLCIYLPLQLLGAFHHK